MSPYYLMPLPNRPVNFFELSTMLAELLPFSDKVAQGDEREAEVRWHYLAARRAAVAAVQQGVHSVGVIQGVEVFSAAPYQQFLMAQAQQQTGTQAAARQQQVQALQQQQQQQQAAVFDFQTRQQQAGFGNYPQPPQTSGSSDAWAPRS